MNSGDHIITGTPAAREPHLPRHPPPTENVNKSTTPKMCIAPKKNQGSTQQKISQRFPTNARIPDGNIIFVDRSVILISCPPGGKRRARQSYSCRHRGLSGCSHDTDHDDDGKVSTASNIFLSGVIWARCFVCLETRICWPPHTPGNARKGRCPCEPSHRRHPGKSEPMPSLHSDE